MTQPEIRRRRTRTAKLVVTGAFDAGKTTLIGTVSDSTVLTTERRLTSAEADGSSERTTVAMDFGRIGVEPDLALFLFGTPGQERFEFMWDILAEGMLGFVLVVDASRPATFEESARLRRRFTAAGDVPHVVAVNKAEPHTDTHELVGAVRAGLELPAEVPVVVADARVYDDAREVVLAFLRRVLDHHRRRTHALTSAGGAG